jgi:holo-[acyl-carrier protein] synthase
MIIGIGCDIVDIRRIKRLIKQYKNKFLDRVFTKDEIKLAIDTHNYSYFAKRFAAKEAYAKATRYGIGGKLSFKSIEIFNDDKRAPFFNQPSMQPREIQTFLSISDEYPYAIAYVVLEKK